MAIQDKEQLVRSMYENFNNREFDQLSESISSDFEWMNVPFGERFHGPEGARQFLTGWASAIPDAQVTLSTVAVADEYAIAEFFFRGTHTGTLHSPSGPIQATGKRLEVPVCEVMHFSGGKIDSTRTYYDAATMMRQLGLMPAVGAQGQQPTA